MSKNVNLDQSPSSVFPCKRCITYAICQNKTLLLKWDECWMFHQYMQENGFFEYQGQIISFKSHASTTYVEVKYEGE